MSRYNMASRARLQTPEISMAQMYCYVDKTGQPNSLFPLLHLAFFFSSSFQAAYPPSIVTAVNPFLLSSSAPILPRYPPLQYVQIVFPFRSSNSPCLPFLISCPSG